MEKIPKLIVMASLSIFTMLSIVILGTITSCDKPVTQIERSEQETLASPQWYSQEDIELAINLCKNNQTGLVPKMTCVNDYVKSIFKYVIREDSLNLTREQIVNEGGDCGSWSDFYKGVADDIGYNFTMVRLDVTPESAHRLIIVFNNEGYCGLDQTDIHCFKYSDLNITQGETNENI